LALVIQNDFFFAFICKSIKADDSELKMHKSWGHDKFMSRRDDKRSDDKNISTMNKKKIFE
jgi:hypothetical protein